MLRDKEAFPTGSYAEALASINEADFTRLSEILPTAFDNISVLQLVEFLPIVIEADSADVIVSRDDEGKIASVIVVNVDYGAGRVRGRIDDVATHQDSLRQGHAASALDFALDWFRMRDVRRITLTSNNSRLPAHKLYESRGFMIHDTNFFQLDLQ